MIAPQRRCHLRRALLPGILLLATTACARSPQQVVLTADMPLHLEDHLDATIFTEQPATNGPKTDAPKPVEWRFNEPQPDWKATPQLHPSVGAATLVRTGDALRVTLTERTSTRALVPNGTLVAGIHVDLPDWNREDWAEVVIRTRAGRTSSVVGLGLRFDLRTGQPTAGSCVDPYEFLGENSPIIADDRIHTYRLRVLPGLRACGQATEPVGTRLEGPWRQLALWFRTNGKPGSIDLLSVTVVPNGAVPVPSTVEWRFDQPQPDWNPVLPNPSVRPALAPARVERTTDALRVTLPEGSRHDDKLLHGGIYIDLPGWRREEWAHVIVRARTTTVTDMTIGLTPTGGVPFPGVRAAGVLAAFAGFGGTTPVVSDGSVQTYQIRPNWGRARSGTWLRVGFRFRASEPGSIDILSVTVVPITALYASDRPTFKTITIGRDYRRTLVTHAPGRVEYRIRVPEGGRLQAALGVLNVPVEFRVTVQAAGGEATTMLRETQSDSQQWAKRTVDVASFAGKTITLGLETTSSRTAAVAFWGSPMISGSRSSDKPNVILYVIDGGWADDMSVYGYNRRTTPNLERLAAQGVVFEHAYSNATSTKPSTASFMTSLHASVLGFTGDRSDQLPENAVTMAERFHRAGYQTGVFTANPNAATVTGLERWADLMHEPPTQNDIISSARLNTAFWSWREDSSGQPYWAHFQPTDVHAYEGRNPVTVVPFSGTFVAAQRRREFFEEWAAAFTFWPRYPYIGDHAWITSLQAAGIDRVAFFETMRALYDESLAHQDYQIGQLVERLRERGEWENTLLIIAGDHAVAASLKDLGTLVQTNPPPAWTSAWGTQPILRSSITRVPLIFVWPGRITGGQRFEAPVSMIDLLPTVLDLTRLPMPDVMQGQSLGPLLRGQPGWTRRPVILEEVNTRPGQPQRGTIEAIDGRWGASLQIGPESENPEERRPWPLLLYDVWADPLALRPVNEQHPELVKKYTRLLEDAWGDHQLMAKQFKPGPKSALTPEQLERLRALGYIR